MSKPNQKSNKDKNQHTLRNQTVSCTVNVSSSKPMLGKINNRTLSTTSYRLYEYT